MTDETSAAYRCSVCGKITAGRVSKGGDGTFMYPRRHNGPNGKPCRGNLLEAKTANCDIPFWGQGDHD